MRDGVKKGQKWMSIFKQELSTDLLNYVISWEEKVVVMERRRKRERRSRRKRRRRKKNRREEEREG